MPYNFLQKSLTVFLTRQTNILSAALIIMITVVLSQVLGLIRQRLLTGIFGASDTLGIYFTAAVLPDTIFQLVIAGALTSAFIPVFSDYLAKGEEKEGNIMASTLLLLGLCVFMGVSLIMFAFAPFFLQLFNIGARFSHESGYSLQEMALMANLMRVILVGQLLFIVGTFFSVLLQSYNQFFLPGIAAALYNVGIIVGILLLSSHIGIFAPTYGIILGALLFIAAQLPLMRKIGFSFRPQLSMRNPGVLQIIRLMWPRTLAIAIMQVGTFAIVVLISFLSSPGRNFVIFDLARTLAFAPVLLFGQTIAQAAFPVLSRLRTRADDFKSVFMTSFTQMLYLVLPVSILFLVLRIPIVRLVYGAERFDWEATVLTGRTLAFFTASIFAQALSNLVSRAFYAHHDTKTPLLINTMTTMLMIALGGVSVLYLQLGVESIALAYSLGTLVNLVSMFLLLDQKVGGFDKKVLFTPIVKILVATIFTGFALYIPIKLLDQLVIDTTRTVNLIILTGISSFAGLLLYLFLTWLFNVKEAMTFILIFRKIGNWKEILGKSDEAIEGTQFKP